MKLPVLLQALGLAGLPVAAFIAFGSAASVAVGSGSLIVAGTVLELERRR